MSATVVSQAITRHTYDVAVVAPKLRRRRRDWPEYAARLTPERVRDFWSHVTIGGPNECWPWKGATRQKGYGNFALFGTGKGSAASHRIAYGLANGGTPRDMDVLHRCDNPPCCNHAHLFLGTQLDNIRDMIEKGRNYQHRKTHCRQGHPFTPDNTYLCPRKGRGYYPRCLCRCDQCETP